MAVVIGRAILPPNGAALTQRLLGGMDALAGFIFAGLVSGHARVSDIAARLHERVDQAVTQILRQGWVGAAPQPAAYHQITAIGGNRMGRCRVVQSRLPVIGLRDGGNLAGTCRGGGSSLPVRRNAMASQPDPVPDRIDPQSPSEVPVAPEPTEAPDTDLPSVEPPPPDIDIPDTAPPEITPDQFSG